MAGKDSQNTPLYFQAVISYSHYDTQRDDSEADHT